MEVVTKKQPTEQELKDMELGMKVVKHVKSNAIVVVKMERQQELEQDRQTESGQLSTHLNTPKRTWIH